MQTLTVRSEVTLFRQDRTLASVLLPASSVFSWFFSSPALFSASSCGSFGASSFGASSFPSSSLPSFPDSGGTSSSSWPWKNVGCNLLAVIWDRAHTLLYATLFVPFPNILKGIMCRHTRTCTGSVTLGAGSEDPPPNKVEIVLPSSEKQQSNISVTQRDFAQCDRCRMSEESESGTEPRERLCQPVAVGRRAGFYVDVTNRSTERKFRMTRWENILVNVDSSSFSSSTVSKTDSTCEWKQPHD